MRILLVEDEPSLARWLAKSLARYAGFIVEWADDGLLAVRRLELEEYDAVILDLGLPGLDGAGVLARMRARDDRTPVLVLTARDSLNQRIDMLHQGADDFLAKPFEVGELEARLTALVRRSRGKSRPRLMLGNLSLDNSLQQFYLSEQPLALSPRETAVLRVLMQRSGEPVSKQSILDRVVADDKEVNLEAIEVIVHRLRKKLTGSGAQIVTVRGVGYSLEALTTAISQASSTSQDSQTSSTSQASSTPQNLQTSSASQTSSIPQDSQTSSTSQMSSTPQDSQTPSASQTSSTPQNPQTNKS